MSDPFDIFKEFFGGESKSSVDLRIAFDIWCEKQPFFQKIPTDLESTIKVKTGDFRKIAAAAYTAGYNRAKL